MSLIKTIKNEQSGIALILSVIILMAIFGLVIVVADVAFDIRASNKSIGSSEIALFAAESAAELAIYDIEYNGAGYGSAPVVNQVITLPSGNDAYWSREIQLSTSTPGLCILPDATIAPSPACTDNLGTINTTNPLKVKLKLNQSFQLDLDLENTNDFYPNHVKIDLSPGGARMIVSGRGVQNTFTAADGEVSIPPSGNLRFEDDYKIRIIKESGSDDLVYTITTQNAADELPLGLEIRASGQYLDTERNIVIIRPAWLIY